MPEFNSPYWWTVISTITLGVGIGVLAQPQLAMRFMTAKNDKSLNRAVLIGGIFILAMTGIAFTVGALSNVFYINTQGLPAIAAAGGNTDLVIPNFITASMPSAFVAIFLVTLLAAAMSTLSSQFHTMGTAVGRDIYQEGIKKGKGTQHTIMWTRIGMIITIAISAILAFILPISVIARATAIFFGLCASAFLPAFVGALYWKRMTKTAAIWSMVIGTIVSMFWIVFIHAKEATALGISQTLFGQDYIGGNFLAYVDPVVVALPISAVVAIVVSLVTKAPNKKHLDKCFKNFGKAKPTAALTKTTKAKKAKAKKK